MEDREASGQLKKIEIFRFLHKLFYRNIKIYIKQSTSNKILKKQHFF